MKNWYNSLTPRERNLVIYGSIAVTLILLWLILIKPLYKQHNVLSNDIENKSNALELMKGQSAQIKQLQNKSWGGNVKKTTGNPQQWVERSLQTWRLKTALQRMQSQGEDAVRLTLKNVNADRFMRFLQELENKYSLTVENMSITADKEPGLVDVRLTMKR